MKLLVSVISLVSTFLISAHSIAELETGIGLSAVHVPHYLGSDEAENYVLPFPYIRYRSEKLNIDRNFIQGKIFQSGKFSIEISLGGAIPVDSERNEAREGMDDLNFIGELGPALQYHFRGNRLSENALYVSLPLRGAISTDFTQARYRGYTFNPRLVWRRAYQYDGLLVRSQISTGIRSASSHMHDYIYGVDTEYMTEEREKYSAKSGYGGATLSYSSSLLFDDYLLAGFVRYANISGASFEDSPLVRQNTSLLFGVAWAYLF